MHEELGISGFQAEFLRRVPEGQSEGTKYSANHTFEVLPTFRCKLESTLLLFGFRISLYCSMHSLRRDVRNQPCTGPVIYIYIYRQLIIYLDDCTYILLKVLREPTRGGG